MSRLQQKWLLYFLIILSLTLVGCSSPSPTPADETEPPADTGEEPTEPGGEEPGEGPQPITGETQAPVPADLSLDPANASGDVELAVNDLLYDGLTALDENGDPVGFLASSWLIAEDGLAYTFFLRPGLTFSDGTPVDADAVSANFNRWFDPADPLRGSGAYETWETLFVGFKDEFDADQTPLSLFDGIEKVDALTVIIHLNVQDPDLLVKLAEVPFSIVSGAALEAADGDYGTDASDLGGSGAYLVGEWTAEQLVLVPNPGFWGAVPADNLIYPVE